MSSFSGTLTKIPLHLKLPFICSIKKCLLLQIPENISSYHNVKLY